MSNVKAIIKGSPILHNGIRYDIGSEIELTQAEADKISLYLEVQAVENSEKKPNQPENNGSSESTESSEGTQPKGKKKANNLCTLQRMTLQRALACGF